eukprot:6789026-Prymnesium_polylepis.1
MRLQRSPDSVHGSSPQRLWMTMVVLSGGSCCCAWTTLRTRHARGNRNLSKRGTSRENAAHDRAVLGPRLLKRGRRCW